MKKNIGIFIFDNVEVLDFCGPFEVFSVASEINNFELFEVFTAAKTTEPILAVNGLSVNPKYSFQNAPHIDILIISGGAGTRQVINDDETLNWINKVHLDTEYTASICTGARILGKLGYLDHKPYVTHHQAYENLAEIAPLGIPIKNKRFIQSGKIFTSGGISAGIDLSFHIVELVKGKIVAKETAAYMEYKLSEEIYTD